ncbi:peroxisomal membrane protein 2 [Fistulifera solaris]|jgi:hypothetical protein|uniref:Peroxisomal membrane protein 2 n=1 Tax=Fistulifera solaris TaxID=1519565 RepID=A0A1Z5K881_FISSO|nr:peroxisomal membrane protein 2 [Fistulifera solaris]|eukprot:GAX22362.1 peroxisomal membrane protein 2 [Fistulifera solaris]
MSFPPDDAENEWEYINGETRPLLRNDRKVAVGGDESDAASENRAAKTSLWDRYCELLETHPLFVKSVTALFIVGSGDLCAQGVEHLRGTNHSASVDWLRVARFGAIGFFGAPWSHYYFSFLDHYLPPTEKPFTRRTFVKVLIDQFIQAPILLLLMISGLSLLQLNGIEGVKKSVRDTFWTSLVANWKFWITASFINLAFVRPEFRVLFLNCGFLIWIIILSIILNSEST